MGITVVGSSMHRPGSSFRDGASRRATVAIDYDDYEIARRDPAVCELLEAAAAEGARVDGEGRQW